jgi:hypothetical protein
LQGVSNKQDELDEMKETCKKMHGNSKELAVASMKPAPSLSFKKMRRDTSATWGGAFTWPLWMVQLVLEQLVNGTPPTSISPNIASHIKLTMPGVDVDCLPSLSFVRKCRTVLRVIGETLTAYRLAKAEGWEQLFTDGTGRRQVAMQNLVLSVIEDDVLYPLILSSSIILEDETSEKQCNAVLDIKH